MSHKNGNGQLNKDLSLFEKGLLIATALFVVGIILPTYMEATPLGKSDN